MNLTPERKSRAKAWQVDIEQYVSVGFNWADGRSEGANLLVSLVFEFFEQPPLGLHFHDQLRQDFKVLLKPFDHCVLNQHLDVNESFSWPLLLQRLADHIKEAQFYPELGNCSVVKVLLSSNEVYQLDLKSQKLSYSLRFLWQSALFVNGAYPSVDLSFQLYFFSEHSNHFDHEKERLRVVQHVSEVFERLELSDKTLFQVRPDEFIVWLSREVLLQTGCSELVVTTDEGRVFTLKGA